MWANLAGESSNSGKSIAMLPPMHYDHTVQEILKAEALSFSIQNRVIFSDVSFTLCKGQSLVLRGPNGAGKSTILKGLLGHRLLQGRYTWSLPSEEVGYLPQLELGDSLSWMNVQDFVESGVEWAAWRGPFPPKPVRDETMNVLSTWDLSNLRNRNLNELSKGQLQKAAWARTFRSTKKIYLLDEPLTFMDRELRAKCLAYLENLKKNGVSFVSVFHDTDIPASLEDITVKL
ncbi:MAG: ATP-binding cassette domain-containing protein [Bdellovibrionota bacterium]